MQLEKTDLIWCLRKTPKDLRKILEDPKWENKLFLGGGFIRSCLSGDYVNDIDLFVPTKELAMELAFDLAQTKNDIHKTENAITIKRNIPIQIIHRWLFESAEEVAKSFDFTICSAVIFYKDGQYQSYTDESFYVHLATKKLVYRSPQRNEDAGGSTLRVLKYYQKGYRIPLDSFGAVLARLVKSIRDVDIKDEKELARFITAKLVEVDPLIDPTHAAHLPSQIEEKNNDGTTIN